MGIVEFETEDGTEVLVKVADGGPGGRTGDIVVRGLGESDVVERAHRTFEAALRPIRAVSESVLAELRGAARQPDSVTVEFGLEFTAHSSAVIVDASGSATIRVQLTWNAQPAGDPPADA
jgi:hypothetical protein